MQDVAERGIYVEIRIRADVNAVWQYTQEPQIHELWDLRFSTIRYLPRADASQPQRFLYSTRIGFGLTISGKGESTGTHDGATGERTSALRFWSDDPRSLIREGSGYWRYLPTQDGSRFLTWYDYSTRFGAAGELLDRCLFRPLMGWATAWSFDRLRLWLDEGLHPRAAMALAIAHGLARIGIAFVWLWQGLVPKLLHASQDEKAMLAAVGIPERLLPLIGGVEIAFGVAVIVLWRWRPLFVWNSVAMIAAVAVVALHSPEYLAGAFNPVSLNVAVVVLSAIGFAVSRQIPSSAGCLRRPAE
jgi:DoxX-like family